jgi:hypothetical protein
MAHAATRLGHDLVPPVSTRGGRGICVYFSDRPIYAAMVMYRTVGQTRPCPSSPPMRHRGEVCADPKANGRRYVVNCEAGQASRIFLFSLLNARHLQSLVSHVSFADDLFFFFFFSISRFLRPPFLSLYSILLITRRASTFRSLVHAVLSLFCSSSDTPFCFHMSTHTDITCKLSATA